MSVVTMPAQCWQWQRGIVTDMGEALVTEQSLTGRVYFPSQENFLDRLAHFKKAHKSIF